MSKNSINDNKTFEQFAEAIMRNVARTMNCVKIGEIVYFDPLEQTATVRVLHLMDENYDTDMKETIDYPLLGKVPVMVWQGGGSRITFPIKPGDQCLLLFCDYMIDNWWVIGEMAPSDFPRKHDLSDAIAIVGLNALPKAIKDYSLYLHLKYDEKSDIVIGEQIDVNNQTINLNGNTNVLNNLTVAQDVTVTQKATAQELHALNGASGSFATADNKTVTVVDGIIVSIQ